MSLERVFTCPGRPNLRRDRQKDNCGRRDREFNQYIQKDGVIKAAQSQKA
jgi:hypothetical protein